MIAQRSGSPRPDARAAANPTASDGHGADAALIAGVSTQRNPRCSIAESGVDAMRALGR
jgi:hypothetical protein